MPRDEIIGPSHARALFAAAREPKRLVWIEDAGHNDLVAVAGEEYGRALRELADLVSRSHPPPPR